MQDWITLNKTKYARFLLPLRVLALIFALWAFVAYLRVLLYGGQWETAVPAFVVASVLLIAISRKREGPPVLEGDETVRPSLLRLPWPILTYCCVTGTGLTWVCTFLWFSRRYAFFSSPVVGAMGLILAFYAVVGVVVAWLTGGNWRTVMLTFWLALWVPSIIVLRLRLLE